MEIPNKFYPRDCSYTKAFPGNFRFNGLNTAVSFSKVHKNLNEFWILYHYYIYLIILYNYFIFIYNNILIYVIYFTYKYIYL